MSKNLLAAAAFQSTLPHGSDQSTADAVLRQHYFNPRSLTGATRRGNCSTQSRAHFNPRSLTGATTLTTYSLTGLSDFNPRSLTGATKEEITTTSMATFQSTLPHGSDCFAVKAKINVHTISIHAPSRERRQQQ